MLSKFINPKRTTVSAHNLSAFLTARLGKVEGKRLLQVLVQKRVSELEGVNQDQSLKMNTKAALTWPETVYAARLKGALVGEGLFDLYSKGKVSSETMRTYLTVPVDSGERFREFYNLILKRLETKF